ncbi:hypothetical protein [Microbispora sp. KK1-11]|uniref:hypothetical protein n=1 Tax=Microbispora sp. KK1-11 TaxID=2053005 RepID=UPI00115BBEAD|nr:hypothetical protein [Microbispora sp. KK1-11]TQS25053.1 hypothetical protein FLW16_32705 [Microbispora sp. KK1-11]
MDQMGAKGAQSFSVVEVSARRAAVAALVIGMSALADVPQASAAPIPQGVHAVNHDCHGLYGHAPGEGKRPGKGGARGARTGRFGQGGVRQSTSGVNTANAPTISSPAHQRIKGRRNVNAPAANSAVDFSGIQQVSSVSVFTNSLSGNCRRGTGDCVINQNLRSTESRGGVGH